MVVKTLTGVAPGMVVLILARELLVTSFRGMSEAGARTSSAAFSGKLKMVLQLGHHPRDPRVRELPALAGDAQLHGGGHVDPRRVHLDDDRGHGVQRVDVRQPRRRNVPLDHAGYTRHLTRPATLRGGRSLPDLLKAILLGIVEGVTEFLPISSTGHLLLCQRWMGIDLESGFWNMFAVFIQISAIAAVAVYFAARPRTAARPARPPTDAAGNFRLGPKACHQCRGGRRAGGVRDAGVLADDAPVTARKRGHADDDAGLHALVVAFFADEWAEKHMTQPWVIAAR